MAAEWKPSGRSLHLAPQDGEGIQRCQLLLPHAELRVFQNTLRLYRFLIRAACVFQELITLFTCQCRALAVTKDKSSLAQPGTRTEPAWLQNYYKANKVCAVLMHLSQGLLICSHTVQGMHCSACFLVSWKLPLNVSKPRINVASRHQSANQ